MRTRFLPSLLIFTSSYFPLSLIFIIKDLNPSSLIPQHPITALCIFTFFSVSCVVVLKAARSIKNGLPVTVTNVSSKSGDMFTYTIPYMIAFYSFNLGDWKTLACLGIFMVIMFTLSYRTQNLLINPVLALAGYGLYECQFMDGDVERQGLLISKRVIQANNVYTVERISHFLFFAVQTDAKETTHDN